MKLMFFALYCRWFGGRQIVASNWNGKEKFEIKETAEQEAERLRKWDEYLESGGENPEFDKTASNTSDNKSGNMSSASNSKQTVESKS